MMIQPCQRSLKHRVHSLFCVHLATVWLVQRRRYTPRHRVARPEKKVYASPPCGLSREEGRARERRRRSLALPSSLDEVPQVLRCQREPDLHKEDASPAQGAYSLAPISQAFCCGRFTPR